MQPTLLAFCIAPAKLAKLRVLCVRMGVRLRTVRPAEYGQSLGALAGLCPPDAAEAPSAPLPDEMLVLAHFRPGMLEALLDGFRQARIPPVALKAMLTETNAGWTPPELFREISAEHESMRSGTQRHGGT